MNRMNSKVLCNDKSMQIYLEYQELGKLHPQLKFYRNIKNNYDTKLNLHLLTLLV